jgi:hypothetical protein
MEGTAQTGQIVRLGGNISLLAALSACLALWGGISLMLTHSSQPHVVTAPADQPVLPKPVAQWEDASDARRSLADMLLFWLPLGLGAIACASGVVTVATSRERDPDAHRRALIALILSAIPGCLCTLWYLTFSVSPLLR